ncbi:MAG: hypothetical protein IKO19_01755 [Candidatus Riflebacteria bacterium]|nr:hypothetical protein [Candidatus Riflebacteria bacterium]
MKKFGVIFLIFITLFFTGCFSEKNTPFYDSEWIMQNYDNQMQLYYHHLILYPNHRVMLRASYADSTNILVWTGTYKINSKKINFNFAECVKYENGEIVGQYKSGAVVKFYQGDFYYSVAELGEEDLKQYHLELIRPKNYFYGENKDIFGNPLEEFIKTK